LTYMPKTVFLGEAAKASVQKSNAFLVRKANLDSKKLAFPCQVAS
jgi:hypothetical protein